MNKYVVQKVMATGLLLILAGCASLQEKDTASLNADQVSQLFFTDLQRDKRHDAYELFAKGLSQTISYAKFDEFMDTLQEHWGRIQDDQTVVMPFHKRPGESDFIPLNTSEDQIRRYVYDVKYENAEVNCDLTLVRIHNEYKIVWISFWGSSNYMTPEINTKIQELFSQPGDSDSDDDQS